MKTFTITFYFNYYDWICSKVRFGIRLNSVWIGVNFPISSDKKEKRNQDRRNWL